jgi:hypothetical protein
MTERYRLPLWAVNGDLPSHTFPVHDPTLGVHPSRLCREGVCRICEGSRRWLRAQASPAGAQITQSGAPLAGTPQGAINEAIATLDHIGRPDLGTAVKDLWRRGA